jgi:soluble lytic murein transglycosylase-like protein
MAVSDIQEKIRQTAAQYGVDPALALAVAQQESSFNQSARGSAGEIGVMQLMPYMAQRLGVDPYNVDDNIRGGVMLLAQELSASGGDVSSAVAAYNAGRPAVVSGNIPSSTRSYVSSVLSLRSVWSALTGGGDNAAPAGGDSAAVDNPYLYTYASSFTADDSATALQVGIGLGVAALAWVLLS